MGLLEKCIMIIGRSLIHGHECKGRVVKRSYEYDTQARIESYLRGEPMGLLEKCPGQSIHSYTGIVIGRAP